MKSYFYLIYYTSLLLLLQSLYSQSSNLYSSLSPRQLLLPDISVIGDITTKFSTDENDITRDKITFREVEVAFQGYLYPEIRTDIFLALHRHQNNFVAELCEGYVNFLKTLPGLNLKVGKIHIDFGKINKVHSHERPYTDQPIVLTNFFGEHGFVGEGVNISYLFPLPFFVQLDFGRWFVPSVHHHEEETEEGEAQEFNLANNVTTTKLWASVAIAQDSELELGFSGAIGNGSHYVEHQDDVQLFCADLTYKWWITTYQKIILQTEIFNILRVVPVGELSRNGYYTFVGYQINKYWNFGFRYDWSENVFPEKVTSSKISTVVTKNLTETTKLRLQYNYNIESQIQEGFLQLVFGLGPHSHPLQ